MKTKKERIEELWEEYWRKEALLEEEYQKKKALLWKEYLKKEAEILAEEGK
jgi:hypothetical protein